MLNKVTLIGNLGNDPEVKKSESGTAYTTFSFATQNRKEDETEWFRVVTFGRTAEVCGEYLKKGSKVFLEGPLRSEEWEDNEGIKRKNYSVIGNTVKFLSTKSEEFKTTGRDVKSEKFGDDIPF